MPQEPFVNLPYLDPAVPQTAPDQVRAYASQFFNTLEELSVGKGTKAFKADPSGLWLGGNLFSEAPFRVDMLGNVVANSILINGLGGDIIAGAINGDGDFINELISTNLNTQSKEILGSFTFGVSGAIAIATDANNGVWISPTGILGKKAGATTFAIESDGDATFGGTLVAASGTFGTITSGSISGVTITGSTIKATGGAGSDVWMDSSDGTLKFFHAGSEKGFMYSNSAGDILFSADENMAITFNDGGGTGNFSVSNDGTPQFIIYDSGLVFGAGDIQCGGTFKSSDGTSGTNTTENLVTSVWWDGGTLKYNYRGFTWKDGLLTAKSGESTATA